MKMYNDTLGNIKTGLLSIGIPVFKFFAHQEKENYIVWGEDSQSNAVWSDGKLENQALSGTVDYFTKKEVDPLIEEIQNILSQLEISFRLNSVQYESDTKYIHYEWVWETWLTLR